MSGPLAGPPGTMAVIKVGESTMNECTGPSEASSKHIELPIDPDTPDTDPREIPPQSGEAVVVGSGGDY